MFQTRYEVIYRRPDRMNWDFWSVRYTWKAAEESARECELRFPGSLTEIKRRRPRK